MRVRGDLPPSGTFTLEEQPKKPGFFLARFFENAVPFEETKDGLTIRGYEYDEYHLELADTGSLREDVLGNFDNLLAQAKDTEEPAPTALSPTAEEQLRADIDYLAALQGVIL